jgi:hypothetical protein
MSRIDYSLKFPYGTNHDKTDLTHEFRIDSLASHYDYRKKLYEEQMRLGHEALFNEIKEFKQVSIYTSVPPAPNFLSVFSSAIADKRTIPYAFVYARDGKVVDNSLFFENFRVIQYRQENTTLSDGEQLPHAVWIMLVAEDVK